MVRTAIRLLAVIAALALIGCNGSNYASTRPAPRPSKYHEENLLVAQSRPVDLLFIGDSITYHWRDKGKATWQEQYAPRHAAVFAAPADRTEHVLWRLDHGELEHVDPRCVVIMIGTNNVKSGPVRMSPAETAAGVRAVVELVGRKLPDAKILLLGILPRQPKYDWIAQAIADTNARLAKLGDGKSVYFLDMSEAFLDDQGQLRSECYSRDLLHLSPTGYEAWAKAMQPALDGLCGP